MIERRVERLCRWIALASCEDPFRFADNDELLARAG
jgi:hypothetical protein